MTLKGYVFAIAPFIAETLTTLGYDADKLQRAIESNGNDKMRLDTEGSGARSKNRFTPSALTGGGKLKLAKSAATVTQTLKFNGDGNPPEEFAAWHDSLVGMAKTFGELTAFPLPVRVKSWLDAKFRADGKPILDDSKGKGHRNGNVESVAAPAVPK